MKNISDKSCREIRNTHFVLINFSFFPENRAVYEIMRIDTVELVRPRMMWRMRVASWITKAANTHSYCVILIAFPLKQWLHERASMLHYTY
jgi:hypothetical protein